MARTTIDFGIDLGTTNSSIAVLKGTDQEVIKNLDPNPSEYTPSAVWIDKRNALIVGRAAKEKCEDDPENAFCEFKLQMGTVTEYTFVRSGRRLKPEELSAEVLKSLKADVRQRTGEDLHAAVITVPAAFDLPQCKATNRAAELAGFSVNPLVQEPVAAAMAYGFQSDAQKAFWIIYDLGGGTFDAAIVQLRDGAIQVVNHGGDNHLGGKLFDWEIVDQLLIPALTKEFHLTDFRRGNPKWAGAIAKLKGNAEQGKILVSRHDSTLITIDPLCRDDKGDEVCFEYELTRKDMERLAEPFILRSINICKKVLEEKRLGPGNIEKICLVGGPTLMPYLRERLADRNAGLGIPLDFSRDPLTVVACGAAIFAGTQRFESAVAQPLAEGQYAIELEYEPVGADTEPLVGGKVLFPEGEAPPGFAIQFTNADAKPMWRSGKIGLSPEGAFMTNVWAEKGHPNTFLIELFDNTGTKRVTAPDRFTYTIGMTITAPPLIHSVGVALANNEMAWFLEKGTPLPAKKRIFLRTAVNMRRGQSGDVLPIPVMEGEHKRADRNGPIGILKIKADNITRDIPVGQEIEITIHIDESRLLKTAAYLPILDEEFEEVIVLGNKEIKPHEGLMAEIEAQKKRLESVREKVKKTGDDRALLVLQRIDAERMVHEVDSAAAAALNDQDARQKCEKRLLELKASIDEIDDALEWPGLVATAHEELEIERKIVNNTDYNVTSKEKETFAILERELFAAIDAHEHDVLARKIQDLDGLGTDIMLRQPGWWVGQLRRLEEKKETLTDQNLAEQYIAQGHRAIQNNDVDSLKAAVRQIFGLLPVNAPERASMSGVMR